jgi:hypothetical protein
MLAVALAWVVTSPARCGAQIVDERWSPVQRLSTEQRRTASAAMVPDPFGYLHALWIESQDAHGSGAVRYARFDGTAWSELIVLAPMQYADSNHRSVAGAVDRDGVLHVVWNSGIVGPANYARAPVRDAASESSWSWPRSIGFPAYRVALQVDPQGVLHLLFSRFYDDHRGVYYARSTDGGHRWTVPVQLDPDIPPTHAPFYIALRLDDLRGLHAVWHYYVPETARGKAIQYARSTDGGDHWDRMTLAAPDESGEDLWKANPSLAVSGDEVHVIWAGGARNSTFRVHRLSTDRGAHWGAPTRIFGRLVGEANGDGVAVDALGRIHWAGQVRYPQAVYHALWSGGGWSTPEPVYLIAKAHHDPIGDRIHAHNVRLGIRAGMQLVVSFTGTEAPTVLVTTQRTLDDVREVRVGLPDPPTQPTSLEMRGLILVVLIAAASALRQRLRRQRAAG